MPFLQEPAQKSENKTGTFCILYRNLELDSKSMKLSILEDDNFQWHLRRDVVTPQILLFSQHFN